MMKATSELIRKTMESGSSPDERCIYCGTINKGSAHQCTTCKKRTQLGVQYLYAGFEDLCRKKKVFYHLIEIAGILGLLVAFYLYLTNGWKISLSAFIPGMAFLLWSRPFFREIGRIEEDLKSYGLDPWKWRDG